MAIRFAEKLAEVLRGDRPAGQLRSVAGEQRLTALVAAQRGGGFPGARCVRLRSCTPAAGVIEAVGCFRWQPAQATDAYRMLAVSFRLVRSTDRWQCAELQILHATPPEDR